MSIAAWRGHVNLFLFLLVMTLGVIVRLELITSGSVNNGFFFQSVAGAAPIHDVEAAYPDLMIFGFMVFVFYFVFYSLGNRAADRASSIFSWEGKRTAPVIMCALFSIIGIAVFLIGIQKVFGSINDGLDTLSKRASASDSGTRGLKFIFNFLLVFIAIGIALAKDMKGRLPKLTFVVLGLADVYLLFRTGSRGSSAIHFFVFSLLFLWGKKGNGYGLSRVKLNFLLILTAVATLYFVVLGEALRDAARGVPLEEAVGNALNNSMVVFSKSLPILDLFATVKIYVAHTGYDYGQQFLNYFLRFVPRALWPNKPEINGILIREFFAGDDISGVPPTFAGEFYIAYGQVGLLFCAMFYGWILRTADALWRYARLRASGVVIAAFVTPIASVRLMREGMEIALFFFLYLAIAFLGFRILARIVTGSSGTQRLDPAAR